MRGVRSCVFPPFQQSLRAWQRRLAKSLPQMEQEQSHPKFLKKRDRDEWEPQPRPRDAGVGMGSPALSQSLFHLFLCLHPNPSRKNQPKEPQVTNTAGNSWKRSSWNISSSFSGWFFLCLLCFQQEDPTWNFGLIPFSAGAGPCGFRQDFEPLFLNSKHPKKRIFGISRFTGGLVEILFWVTLQSSPHAEV